MRLRPESKISILKPPRALLPAVVLRLAPERVGYPEPMQAGKSLVSSDCSKHLPCCSFNAGSPPSKGPRSTWETDTRNIVSPVSLQTADSVGGPCHPERCSAPRLCLPHPNPRLAPERILTSLPFRKTR